MARFRSPAGLIALAALLAAGCGSSTGPDTVTLASVSPTPAAINIATSAPVTLTFSHPMMTGMEQYMDLHQGGVTGPVVPMTCAWSPDRTTLTCTPGSPLTPATQYTIHVGAGMMDDQGHMMNVDNWTAMGGQWATSGMMGGTHAGQPVSMMGPGWKHGIYYGMLFTFTTA